MALLRSIATVGGWTMGSRVLGFVRDILIAGVLGAGMVADAFFVAFKLPNFFRRLFAEGAFNAAFVPLFGERLVQEGREPARQFAAEITALMVTALFLFTVLALLFMPALMHLIAPGFRADPEKFALAIELTRLTFPYLMFMALIALLCGMLNTLQRFAATAAAPIFLNVVLITALVLVKTGLLSAPGRALAWGVAAAGIGQFLWLVAASGRAGLMPRLPRPRLTPGVRRLLRLMAPGLVGAGVVQINLVIDVILASTLPQGSVSYLYYADRVNQLPLGVVGVAVGIALLPLLTRQLSAGDTEGARESQNRAIEFALLLTLPAAAALVVLAQPIVAVLFERGAFTAAVSTATANALLAFALGLPAYVLIKALTPGFFARQDTATPVKVAAGAMVLNVLFAIILMQFLAHVGIALATALSAWLNAAALGWLLRRRGYLDLDERLRRRVPRVAAAALVMAAVLYFLADALAPYLAGGLGARIAALVALILVGKFAFWAVAHLLGAVRWREIKEFMRREPGDASDLDP